MSTSMPSITEIQSELFQVTPHTDTQTYRPEIILNTGIKLFGDDNTAIIINKSFIFWI